MITVPGRQYQPPTVQYQGRTQITSAGSWNMKEKQFAIPSREFLNRKGADSPWGILQFGFADTPPNIDRPIAVLKQALLDYGLGAHAPKFQDYVKVSDSPEPDVNDNTFRDRLIKAKATGVLVVFVVLPTKAKEFYGRLKFWADCKVGT